MMCSTSKKYSDKQKTRLPNVLTTSSMTFVRPGKQNFDLIIIYETHKWSYKAR